MHKIKLKHLADYKAEAVLASDSANEGYKSLRMTVTPQNDPGGQIRYSVVAGNGKVVADQMVDLETAVNVYNDTPLMR